MKIERVLRLTASILAIGLASQVSAANFDLQSRGNEICKVGTSFPTPVCYASYAAMMPNAGYESIDVLKKVKALQALWPHGAPITLRPENLDDVGAAVLIRTRDREMLQRYFTVLSVRNIGIDMNRISQTPTHNLIPFVASVRWAGVSGVNGTIHLDGQLALPINLSDIGKRSEPSNDLSNLEAIRYGFEQMFSIGHFNDSSTEKNEEWRRFLETSARQIQFRAIHGDGANADAETLRLIKEVVGPAVLSETIFIPMVRGMSKLFESIFQGLLGETSKQTVPTKP